MYLSRPVILILLSANVEAVLYTEIFPPDLDAQRRNRRLVTVMGTIFDSERARKAMLSLLSSRDKSAQNIRMFVEYCGKYNSGIMDTTQEEEKHIRKSLVAIISHLSKVRTRAPRFNTTFVIYRTFQT